MYYDSILPTTTTYHTPIPCKPPLPFAHLTMSDRFRLYDTLTHNGAKPLPADGYTATWAVLVGLLPAR